MGKQCVGGCTHLVSDGVIFCSLPAGPCSRRVRGLHFFRWPAGRASSTRAVTMVQWLRMKPSLLGWCCGRIRSTSATYVWPHHSRMLSDSLHGHSTSAPVESVVFNMCPILTYWCHIQPAVGLLVFALAVFVAFEDLRVVYGEWVAVIRLCCCEHHLWSTTPDSCCVLLIYQATPSTISITSPFIERVTTFAISLILHSKAQKTKKKANGKSENETF